MRPNMLARSRSGHSKRRILNTFVRAVATAATTTTTGLASGAFLLAHSQSTVHSLKSTGPSRIGRSRFGLGFPVVGASIATSRVGETRMFSSLSDSAEQNSSTGSDKKHLEALCLATLQACEAVTPSIEALYQSIGKNVEKSITKTKADDSVFTIADGLVQFLLTEVLLGKTVGDIVGEEDCAVNLEQKPYMVDDFVVPVEFEEAIDQAIRGVTEARDGLLSKPDHSLYQSLTAFIDPIDGTREFSTQKGEQCTICVGFADTATGKPVAGVVYRPLSHPHPTWAAGAEKESYAASSLMPMQEEENPNKGALLTTNGRISPFLESLMKELDYERAPSGGAGNKMLMLLEGKGTAYIQDRGVSRWDTCGAQAVLEAHGGILCRLDRFLDGNESSYTYRKTDENLDFEPNTACLTKYNAQKGIKLDKDSMAMASSQVKPYANLCGLMALGKANTSEESRAEILNGLKRAAEASPPAYD